MSLGARATVSDADVIVIGSGHNGLVCAAYLARQGYRVLVLERRATIGGAVCTEEMFGGYQMDVGGSVHMMIQNTPIVEDLELSRYGLDYLPLDPIFSAPFEDGSCLTFYPDLDRTCDSIAAISEQDAEAYYRFVEQWRPLNRAIFELFLQVPTPSRIGRQLLARKFQPMGSTRLEQLRSLLQSYGRFITDRFESEKVRTALTWWGAQSGPPPTDSMSSQFFGWQSLLHDMHPARPRGGSGMLTVALTRYIHDHGGSVLPNSEVHQIVVRNQRAVGVVTATGQRYSARRIVSNAHLWITFLQLLADWTPPALRRRVEQVRVGNGFGMALRCATDALPQYALSGNDSHNITRGLQLLCPSVQYLHDAYADWLQGCPARNPAALAMTFSAIDATLAPAGKHLLYVWGQYYPYHLRDGGRWSDIEHQQAKRLLQVVDRYAPGTSEQVRDIYIQSPAEIARKHAMPQANVMHVEMTIDQMFLFRPLPELARYATPLAGLFLANAGMHPGGGIFGAAGYNCSRVVARSLRRRR